MKWKKVIFRCIGNGKGKTTAALGLSVRAVCAGKNVFFAQFVKGMRYSELDVVKYIPRMTIKQFGRNCFIYNQPTAEDIEAAEKGLKDAKRYFLPVITI